MKQYSIDFKYADSLSHYEWRNQSCTLYANNPAEARRKCIELYGLGADCDYEIIKIEEVCL